MADQNFTVERRIRAAMALAGMDFVGLAQALGREGMGARTLRAWADPRDERVPQAHHLRYIADACGISPAFFTADFAVGATGADELEDRVRALEARDALTRDRLERLEGEVRRRSGGRDPASDPTR